MNTETKTPSETNELFPGHDEAVAALNKEPDELDKKLVEAYRRVEEKTAKINAPSTLFGQQLTDKQFYVLTHHLTEEEAVKALGPDWNEPYKQSHERIELAQHPCKVWIDGVRSKQTINCLFDKDKKRKELQAGIPHNQRYCYVKMKKLGGKPSIHLVETGHDGEKGVCVSVGDQDLFTLDGCFKQLRVVEAIYYVKDDELEFKVEQKRRLRVPIRIAKQENKS